MKNCNRDTSLLDDLDASDALSRTVWSIELEEKILECEKLEARNDALYNQVDQWMDSSFYWHKKFMELKAKFDKINSTTLI